MKDWRLIAKGMDFNKIAERHGISPILARLIVNRGITEDEDIEYYLNATLNDTYSPFLMKDMDRTCDIIIDAIVNNKSIRVVGDYDADGVCSSTILIRALREAGAQVSYRLPHRVTDGYGVSVNIVDEAYRDEVDIILTCDNGIAAVNEIAYANKLGIQVIVTDHHEIPFEDTPDGRKYILPKALCIVNPHRPDDEYPYKNICGAVVAYKLAIALKSRIDEYIRNSTHSSIALKEIPACVTDMLLDFAAFATVTDVMPLLNENRVILKYGLRSIKNTQNIGLSALIDGTGVKRDRLSSYHIGFILGPCVNAVGRLYKADYALELFLTENVSEAEKLAKFLIDANEERKATEQNKLTEAYEIIDLSTDGHDYSKDTVIIVYVPECHESLAGLIAGKIKTRYYKPAIVFTDGEEGLKGSGRSIKEYNMYEGLTQVSDLINKFGGHPLACGLSIDRDRFDEFRSLINKNSKLTEKDLIEKYSIDIDMPINYVTAELLAEIQKMEPFGEDNREPLFAQRNLSLVSKKVNAKGNLLTLEVYSPPHEQRQARTMYATMFGDANELYSEIGTRNTITLAYVPEYNTFYERLQIQIKDFK